MIPLAKNIMRYFSLKEIAIVLIAVVVSVSAGTALFLNLKKDVVIDDNGKQLVVKTMKSTVKEVLEQNGIGVEDYDYVSVVLDSELQRIGKNEIHIKRAIPIVVSVDGQDKTFMTYKDTVKEALEDNSFNVSEGDRLEGANPDDKVVSGMRVKVTRLNEGIVSEKVPIPFKVVTRESSHLEKGAQQVAREGNDGIQEKQYKVVYQDGKEVSRELVKEVVALKPTDKIIEVGTVSSYKTSRGETFRYKKAISMRATAYTASFEDTGKSPGHPEFGITATGIRAKKGVIAVDPRVIPLGTRVYVEVAGNTPDYGYAVAADTGGAIKGDLIDLYFDDSGTVRNWGCKRVKVYLLTD